MNFRDLVATSGENGGFTIFDKDKEKKFENFITVIVYHVTKPGVTGLTNARSRPLISVSVAPQHEC